MNTNNSSGNDSGMKSFETDTQCSVEHRMEMTIIDTRDKLCKSITDSIMSDCQGVYYISQDQKEFKEIFDSRRDNSFFVDLRRDMCQNMDDVISHIDHGETLVCVMGHHDFVEYYYHLLSNGSYQEIRNMAI